MNESRFRLAQRRFSAFAVLCVVIAACATPPTTPVGTTTTTSASVPRLRVSYDEAAMIARDAYVYAYPLVVQDVTRVQMSNFDTPQEFPHAPPNQLVHARSFPTADFKAVVRPNVDTLYSAAWLDLGAEPVVLSVPALDRYFTLQMLSLWTDVFAAPGTRTTGRNRAVDFLVAGPEWNGDVPTGLSLIRSPTRFAMIAGRTQTNGPADFENVHRIQDKYKLTPLSRWEKGHPPPAKRQLVANADMTTPPPVLVDRMSTADFFRRAIDLLRDNPPSPIDYPMLHRIERVGLVPGGDFDVTRIPPQIRMAFEKGVNEAKGLIAEAPKESEKGWSYSVDLGAYGANYLRRAIIARHALGANLAADAIYPVTTTDSVGRPLDGRAKYVLHFAKGGLPPVDAFWSVTAYNSDGSFIPNKLGRQALGDRDAMKVNDDGSVDILIQADSPGAEKEPNWLPVASGPFNLLMRLYSPKDDVLRGNWAPPAVRRVE